MAIYLESTDVPATKSVMEIQDVLARYGASSVNIEYERGQPQGIAFCFMVHKVPIPFKLPCRWDNLKRILENNNVRIKKSDTMEDKARRVAWRQLLAWVKSQMALIECGMADRVEVFLPYAIIRNAETGQETTMNQFIREKGILALPPPDKKQA